MNKRLGFIISVALLFASAGAVSQTCGQPYIFDAKQVESRVFAGPRPPSLRIIECKFQWHFSDRYSELCSFTVDPAEFKQLVDTYGVEIEAYRNHGWAQFIVDFAAKMPKPLVWSYRGNSRTVFADSGHQSGFATLSRNLCPQLEEVISH